MIVTPSFSFLLTHFSFPPLFTPAELYARQICEQRNYRLESSVGIEKGDLFFVTHVTDQYV
jgi:hypothetical protein